MKQQRAEITAIGTYVPERKMTNSDLEKLVETNDEWIVQRTGMKERRIAEENMYTSHLCVQAVQQLSESYDKRIDDVDMVLVATTTPDYAFPSVASMLQQTFHITSTAAMDLNATCAGFVYGLHLAHALIASGLHRKVLVVAGETLSKVTDYTDRSTCILFGDGAGAVLVEASDREQSFLSAMQGTQGNGGIHLYRTNLSKTMNGTSLSESGYMVQNGREVYKWAVRTVSAGVMQMLEREGIGPEQLDWFVPHSANLRMIEAICEQTGLQMSQTLYSLVEMGNTSAASIPLALDKGIREGKLKEGNLIMLYGFGGGLTHAGQLLKWTVPAPTSP
ncbi:ketoacyl-ACP synthase III [Marinicrinis sediminis]|uniref:Beta-ketoacyl-[acyl-carrier-protein] synthase III n=1 Tax=Marinicrinis sediminis TaxID=1652465 RepID=A0ABW5R8F4_9BACL